MPTLDSTAQGVYPIAPTPFYADGRIDFDSIDRLTDFYLAAGSTGLTVLGIMGEAPKLDQQESIAIVKRFIARACFAGDCGRILTILMAASTALVPELPK